MRNYVASFYKITIQRYKFLRRCGKYHHLISLSLLWQSIWAQFLLFMEGSRNALICPWEHVVVACQISGSGTRGVVENGQWSY